MDSLTAIAISMLSSSRSRVCSTFKALRHSHPAPALETVLEALRTPADQLSSVAQEAREAASAAMAAADALGLGCISWFDRRYPPLLGCIADPPPVLWTRGDPGVLARPAVAIVGSRAATPYAMQVGRHLAAELAGRGVVVASGLARGVDGAAHRGALEAGGATIAVLGSGLDRIYPPEHAALALEIAASGLLVSELGPGAAPQPEHFPLRNRIISGISLAVVVVEASEQSGSLITARCALEQGREVMAVPGNVLSGRNRGSHALLKDGAKVVESADDILEELRLILPTAAGPARAGEPATETAGASKSLKDSSLLAVMAAGEPYELDDLAERLGVGGARLLPRLMELELAGLVSSAGGRFVRTC